MRQPHLTSLLTHIHRRDTKRHGFTLIELAVVISVIAILAAISLVSYSAVQKSAHNSATISMISQAKKALETYNVFNRGIYPTTNENPSERINACLGTGYPNDSCGRVYYAESCGNGTSQNVTNSPHLDEQLRSILGEELPAIPTPASSIYINISTGCDAVIESTGATYGTYCSQKVTTDSHGNAFVVAYGTSASCSDGNTSYQITYTLQGNDASCGVSGAIDQTGAYKAMGYSINGWRYCTLIGGNIIE
jgi:prepilin-type N-terminal cleavage/methylation domain-containing protein